MAVHDEQCRVRRRLMQERGTSAADAARAVLDGPAGSTSEGWPSAAAGRPEALALQTLALLEREVARLREQAEAGAAPDFESLPQLTTALRELIMSIAVLRDSGVAPAPDPDAWQRG